MHPLVARIEDRNSGLSDKPECQGNCLKSCSISGLCGQMFKHFGKT